VLHVLEEHRCRRDRHRESDGQKDVDDNDHRQQQHADGNAMVVKHHQRDDHDRELGQVLHESSEHRTENENLRRKRQAPRHVRVIGDDTRARRHRVL